MSKVIRTDDHAAGVTQIEFHLAESCSICTEEFGESLQRFDCRSVCSRVKNRPHLGKLFAGKISFKDGLVSVCKECFVRAVFSDLERGRVAMEDHYGDRGSKQEPKMCCPLCADDKYMLNEKEFMKHLSEEEAERTEAFLDRIYSEKNNRVIHCPISGCRHFEPVVERRRGRNQLVRCATHGRFCSRCWEKQTAGTKRKHECPVFGNF